MKWYDTLKATGPFGWLGWLISAFNKNDNTFNKIGEGVNSAFNRYTGAGLTGAEREANVWSAEQAQQQRAWEEEMRNTAYQAEVKDMQKAGLNPALMYGGAGSSGATVPSGASASSVSPSTGNIGDLLGSIMDIALLGAQVENIKADTANKNAEATGRDIENQFKPELLEQNLRKGEIDIKNTEAAITLALANIDRAMSEIEVNKSVIGLNEAEVSEVLARANKEEIEAANEALRAKGIEADNLAKAEQVVLMRTQEAVNLANAALANASVGKVSAETGLISLNTFDTQYDIVWKQKYGSKPDANIASKAMTLLQKAATHKPDWKGFARNLGFIK